MPLFEDKSRTAVLQSKATPFRDGASAKAGIVTLNVATSVAPLVNDYLLLFSLIEY